MKKSKPKIKNPQDVNLIIPNNKDEASILGQLIGLLEIYNQYKDVIINKNYIELHYEQEKSNWDKIVDPITKLKNNNVFDSFEIGVSYGRLIGVIKIVNIIYMGTSSNKIRHYINNKIILMTTYIENYKKNRNKITKEDYKWLLK